MNVMARECGPWQKTSNVLWEDELTPVPGTDRHCARVVLKPAIVLIVDQPAETAVGGMAGEDQSGIEARSQLLLDAHHDGVVNHLEFPIRLNADERAARQ